MDGTTFVAEVPAPLATEQTLETALNGQNMPFAHLQVLVKTRWIGDLLTLRGFSETTG